MSSSKPRPLFTIDPGWLFILAGLATIALGTLVPAQRDLQTLRYQLDELQAKQRFSTDRLAAYSQFLDELEQDDEALYVRLAATQLNSRPEGDQPVILASRTAVPVTDWIDNSVHYAAPAPRFWPDSTISRLSSGAGQLWLLAAGALAVFAGMLLNTAAPRRRTMVEGANLSRLGNSAEEMREESMATCVMEEDVVTINRTARVQRETTAPRAERAAELHRKNSALNWNVPVVAAAGEVAELDLDDVDLLADSDNTIDAADDSEETWCGELEAVDSVDVAVAEPETEDDAVEDAYEDEDEDEHEDEDDDDEVDEDEDEDDDEWEDEDEEDDDEEDEDEEGEEDDDEEEEDEDDVDEDEWDDEETEDDEDDVEEVEVEEDEGEEEDDLFADDDEEEDEEEDDR